MRYLIAPFLLLLQGCEDRKESSLTTTEDNRSEVVTEQDSETVQQFKTIPEECIIYDSGVSDSDDPLLSYQWHLTAIHLDWNRYSGKGVSVGVVDSGVECKHPDLNRNIDFNSSYNYGDDSNNPSPTSSQLRVDSIDSAHGTACAGIIGAVGWNGKGVRGVAPDVSIVGLNAFASGRDADFEDALQRDVDISSNSWGGADSTWLYEDIASIRGVESGCKDGRRGLGTIYVFASGNEGNSANYSPLHGHHCVINVGAFDKSATVPDYSNYGENIAIVAPAGGDDYGIFTTDLLGMSYGMESRDSRTPRFSDQTGDYTGLMNGTSSAVPVVSGLSALLLQANPDLSYRDLKYILMRTAQNHFNIDATPNGAGLSYSPKSGFGVIYPEEAIAMAENFKGLGEEKRVSNGKRVSKNLSKSGGEVEIVIKIDSSIKIEHTELTVNVERESYELTSLSLKLISPAGTESHILTGDSNINGELDNWSFNSLRFLDEDSEGEWRVLFKELSVHQKSVVEGVTLSIRGH
jgi:subtilisin family serine protease